MQILDPAQTGAALGFPELIASLEETFRGGAFAPPRIHHAVPRAGGADITLILMPAWQVGGAIGVKLVTVAPDNAARGLPAICASYLLMDGVTGQPRLMIDGPVLTARRTAAVSALAARYLAPEQAGIHLVIGAGAVAGCAARSHRHVRPIAHTLIWARKPEQARRLCDELRAEGLDARPVEDLDAAAASADIVTTATLASEPVLRGRVLKDDVHLDLIGAYLPHMREVDDAAIAGAAIYADNPDGALNETGELAIPIAGGVIARADLRGGLADLVAVPAQDWRRPPGKTVFKAVGMALSDLAAANCVVKTLDRQERPAQTVS